MRKIIIGGALALLSLAVAAPAFAALPSQAAQGQAQIGGQAQAGGNTSGAGSSVGAGSNAQTQYQTGGNASGAGSATGTVGATSHIQAALGHSNGMNAFGISTALGQLKCINLSAALGKGSRGSHVADLQALFGLTTATGYFGSLTQQAVVHFQAANNIPQTGVVGPLTRQKIRDLTCNGGSAGNPSATSTASTSTQQ